MRKLVLAGALLAMIPGTALAQSETRYCSQTVFQGYTYVQCSDGTTTILEAPQPAPQSEPVIAPAPTPTPEADWAGSLKDWATQAP